MRQPPRMTRLVIGGVAALLFIASVDALRSSDDDQAGEATTANDQGSPTATADEDASTEPATTPADGVASPPRERFVRAAGDIRFSLRVRAPGWESFGLISINKSIVGPQGAEAIIFWAGFPAGGLAEPCAKVLGSKVGPSVADLAAVVATAPGTELVAGPSDVTVGGRAAKRIVLTVRENVGCKPGFFYHWRDAPGGALWPATRVGDTIRVWIVEVDGMRLFLEAETSKEVDVAITQERVALAREIREIVRSIRFH